MEILIIARGGGLGHLTRCGAVAQEARSRGHRVSLNLGAYASRLYTRLELDLTDDLLPPNADLNDVLDWDWDVVLVDADPRAYTGAPLPPGPGKRFLIGRHSTIANGADLEGWAGVFRLESLGFEVPCPVIDVDPVLLANPRPGTRERRAIIAIRGPGRVEQLKRCRAACVSLGISYTVAGFSPFPVGSEFSLYSLVIGTSGCTWHEAQQAGTPGVYLPRDHGVTCDQRGRAEGLLRTPRTPSFVGLENLAEAWSSAPVEPIRHCGHEQILDFIEGN